MSERGTADVSSLKVMNIYLVAHPQQVLISNLGNCKDGHFGEHFKCCNIFVVQQLISIAVCLVSYYKKCKDILPVRASLIQTNATFITIFTQTD